MANPPSLEPSTPGTSPKPREPKQQWLLLQLFGETFLLLGRYFVLVYPIFLYFILSSLVVPKTPPDFSHWAWWVLLVGLMSILFLFKAGWNFMMYKAVQEWQEVTQRTSEEEKQEGSSGLSQIPFGLLKHFIPGIGEYGVPFLIGGFVWILLTGLPTGLLAWIGYQLIGIPAFFISLLNNPQLTSGDIQKALETISAVERTQLNDWNLLFLLMLLIITLLNGLTLFWQQYIIIHQCNPLRAFLYSARQALKHPFNTLVILTCFSTLYLFFCLFAGFHDLAAFFGNFFLILTIVFFGLFTFLYLLRGDVGRKT